MHARYRATLRNRGFTSHPIKQSGARTAGYVSDSWNTMAKQTPEGKIKEKIKVILRKHNVYWHMPVQNGMGAPSLDFICCVNGHYLAIEAKAPGKYPTPRQYATMDQIRAVKGTAIVVSCDTDLLVLESVIVMLSNE